MPPKINILFLCTGNSCRSQMAEGFLRNSWGEKFASYSAGTSPKGIDQRAIKAMREIGVDISSHASHSISDHSDINFAMVITVCGHADANCPVFPSGTTVIHVGFDDPPRLALNIEDEESAMDHYRRVRDEIKSFINDFPNFYNQHKRVNDRINR